MICLKGPRINETDVKDSSYVTDFTETIKYRILCDGDWGSGLNFEYRKKNFVLGVASQPTVINYDRFFLCRTFTEEAGAARIQPFLPFLKETVKDNFCPIDEKDL